jgi:hypothetical protein
MRAPAGLSRAAWCRAAGWAAALWLLALSGCLQGDEPGDRAGPDPPGRSARAAARGLLPIAADRHQGWNAAAFTQDHLWTAGREQYAVWVTAAGAPVVGRRRLPDGPWTTSDLSRVRGNPLRAPTAADGHNVYAIAVDRAGYVHVAGNMHNDGLRYVRSQRPRDISAWRTARMLDTDASSVTYPMFVRRRDGGLLFFYRDGASGEGDVLLNAWNERTRTWRRVAKVIDGRASGESPYLWHVAVDGSDRLHLVFAWRGTPDATTTRDLSYASSPDGGRTWERSDGSRLAVPITHAGAEVVLDTPSRGAGMSNAGGLEIDRRGHPHAAVLLGGRLHHVWHDGRRWQDREIDLPGAARGRPSVVAAPSRGVFAIVPVAATRERTTVWLVDITPGAERRDDLKLLDLNVSAYEPTFDTTGLHADGLLHLMAPGPRGRGAGTDVVSFRVSELDGV